MTTLVTDQPLAFPIALAEARYQRDRGPAPPPSLAVGMHTTLDEFRCLPRSGRLDARKLR